MCTPSGTAPDVPVVCKERRIYNVSNSRFQIPEILRPARATQQPFNVCPTHAQVWRFRVPCGVPDVTSHHSFGHGYFRPCCVQWRAQRHLGKRYS